MLEDIRNYLKNHRPPEQTPDWASALTPTQITQTLEPFVSEERRERIAQVIGNRTKSCVTVLEKIYDPGNCNAVYRTADSLGFYQHHVIQGDMPYKRTVKRVSKGADKWLSIRRWNQTAECLSHLKRQGFKIYATALDNSIEFSQADFTGPFALVLGSEGEGVSEDALALSDQSLRLPMVGFSQSYNVSVAAALAYAEIRRTRLEKLGHHGDLNELEKEALEALYTLKSVQNSELLLNRLIFS